MDTHPTPGLALRTPRRAQHRTPGPQWDPSAETALSMSMLPTVKV